MDNKNTAGSKEFIPASSNASQYAETDLLPSLLHEYEAFVGALQQQVDFYKAEHTSLRSDLKELVTENRHLSDKLKNVVSTKLKNESSVSPHHKKESNMLTNLQQQLSVVAQERDTAVEMWHLTLREVDNQEEALRSYHDNRQMDLAQKKNEDMKQDFSNAVTLLESKLATTRSILVKEKATREEIQKRLEQSLQETAALMSTLKSREQELEKSLEGQCVTARKLQEMEKKSEELQEQVETIKVTVNDLELALTHCHGCIEELVKKKLEALEKVSESLHLVECAMAEKDSAVLQESQIREENIQLQKMMASIIDEAGARVKEEMENIKQQYNKKLEILLHDMKRIEDVGEY
jgi:chromosome segregation ATPase